MAYGTNFYTKVDFSDNVYSGLVDEQGNILLGKFDTLSTPPTTANKFQKGCLMTKTDAANNIKAVYENTGTLASPSWNLVGQSIPGDIALADGHVLVGNSSGVAADVAMSGDITITNAGVTAIGALKVLAGMIASGAVTLAKLATGITPSHIIKFASQLTTVGGSATEAFTVTGAVGATDRAYVQIVNNGTNNVTVLQAVVTDNTLTITFSGDPAADTVFNYQLIRAAS